MVKSPRLYSLPLLVPSPYRTVQLGKPTGGAAGLTIERTGSSVLRLKGKASADGSLFLTVNQDSVTLRIAKGTSAQQVVNALTEALPGYKVASTNEKNQFTVIKFTLPL